MAALARLGAVQNPIIPILREHGVGFITGQLATEFLVVPEFWRGFDHGGLTRALSSGGGFEVITVDLTTPQSPVSFGCPVHASMGLRRHPDLPATRDGFTTRRGPLQPRNGSAIPTRR